MGLGKKVYIKVVDSVSFFIKKGEMLGFVGESGCGKFIIGRIIIRFYELISGQIIFKGEDIIKKDMFFYRKLMQMIFQDLYVLFNLRMIVGDIIGELFEIYNIVKGNEKKERV